MDERDDIMALVCAKNIKDYCNAHTESCHGCIFVIEDKYYNAQCKLRYGWPCGWELPNIGNQNSVSSEDM